MRQDARFTTATTVCNACAALPRSATWPTVASTTSGCPCWQPSASSRLAALDTSSASPRWRVDLFSPDAIGLLGRCTLGNDVLLGCVRSLGLYQHPDTGQIIRVNYAALNVEEFGSVYEGLLEYTPHFLPADNQIMFAFTQGDERAATGSHYTPDDLVQPLIKHSLDYLITEKLQEPEAEKALLSLRVADIACGSGHILLAAARRIAAELAVIRTGEEQPAPAAFRAAVRDVIRECIYGVDLNPLAVELCKVALWLEAHNPGEPLNFLDHHIKCGNAIVGFAHRDEVERGVPDEAFATMPGDDKAAAATFRKRNKAERAGEHQTRLDLAPEIRQQLDGILKRWREVSGLPERSPEDIATKKRRYFDLTQSRDASLLQQIAAIPIAQFYLPKAPENRAKLITDADFRLYWTGQRHPQDQATAAAWAMSYHKRVFHWFLEFPDIIERGGFDCILGNPPYLGGTHLSGTYGYPFCHYMKWEYAPAGLSDLVVYFVRRIYSLLRPSGFTAFITTNSIKDGDIRKDGLEQVLTQGGTINFAVRGIKWPGRANLVVSLVAIHKDEWSGKRVLDGKEVSVISAYFEDTADEAEPTVVQENLGTMLEGSKNRGKGFFISYEQAQTLISEDPRNTDVILPILSGGDITDIPEQSPQRCAIFFADWAMHKAMEYRQPFQLLQQELVAERAELTDERLSKRWWLFERPRVELYRKINDLNQTTQHRHTGSSRKRTV